MDSSAFRRTRQRGVGLRPAGDAIAVLSVTGVVIGSSATARSRLAS